MTLQPPTERPDETPKAPPPRPMTAILWRVLAVAAIVGATVLAAHVLVRPAGRGSVGGGSADGLREDDLFGPVPAMPREVPEAEQAEARSDLASVMAGILMAAAGEEGDEDHPADQTPEERRQFLAERFGLPADYPKSAAPADIVPDGAKVLAVFDHPERAGSRMVLLALEQPAEEVLAALRARYVADGWTVQPMDEPRRQTQRGWLLWFTRGRSHRAVFVRLADEEKETLAAVCDLGYE